jgi:uncharacterized protein YndB with AHSA1/START domain
MSALGNLVVTTPSDREIAMSREFDAPRELVYEAYTRPELLQRWLGVFRGWELAVCTLDLRPGGRNRFVWRNRENGDEMGLTQVVREVVPNERIVCTEEFDDPWYEGEAVATVTFTERAGKTTLTMFMIYDTKAIRDAVLAGPMDQGMIASYDLLEGVLAGMLR